MVYALSVKTGVPSSVAPVPSKVLDRVSHTGRFDSERVMRDQSMLGRATHFEHGGVIHELASVQVAVSGATIHPGWNLLYDGLGHRETVVPHDLAVQPHVPQREIQLGGHGYAATAGIGSPHFDVKVALDVGHVGGDVSLADVRREVEDGVMSGVKKAGDQFLAGLARRG